MIDLKLARLVHDPSYRDGVVDVIGYAALLPEVAPVKAMRFHPRGFGGEPSVPRPGQARGLAGAGSARRLARR